MSTANNEIYDHFIHYIEENQNRFYYLAYSYMKEPNAALDIVQESLYKALKSLDTLKEASYMQTWFYRILVNTSLDELRKNKRTVLQDPTDLSSYQDENTAKAPVTEQAELMDLYQALDELDPQAKTIIVLRYFEDKKLSDIAEILDENINSIKSKLYRSLDKLKLKLKGDVFHDPSR